jgi:hypothetical protein
MKAQSTMPFRITLPLPAFVLRPITAAIIAAAHVYLAAGHLSHLFGGELEWTHIWKGCGALAGAYVFTAIALRGLGQHKVPPNLEPQEGSATESAAAGAYD